MKTFNRILHYTNHQNRKTSCVKTNIIPNETTDILSSTPLNTNLDILSDLDNLSDLHCKYCRKEFSRVDSLTRHINLNSCKIKKELDGKLLKEIEILKQKLLDQAKKIDDINTNKINIQNNNINSNNVTNQINIVSIGKEDMSRLTQEELLKIATSGVFYPIVAAEIIHCNERLPDYQNILISNLRSSKGHLYNIGGTWMTINQDDIIRKVMDVDKVHVTNIIKDVKVDDEKIQNKIQFTKDELKENKYHQSDKVKDKLYSASKMIIKNRQKNTKKLN
jgi:hypothetical protein